MAFFMTFTLSVTQVLAVEHFPRDSVSIRLAFLPSLRSFTPQLFAEVFANERMGHQDSQDCADLLLPALLLFLPG